jgi:hypothetical protein
MTSVTGNSKLISTACKVCGFAFKVQAKFAGKVGKCPSPDCGAPFRVPALKTKPAESRKKSSRDAGKIAPASRPNRSTKLATTKDRSQQRPSGKKQTLQAPHFFTRKRLLIVTSAVSGIAVLIVAAILLSNPDPVDAEKKAPPQSPVADIGDKNQRLTPAQIAAEKKTASAKSMTEFQKHVAPFLKKHCIECHGPGEQSAELAFHTFSDEKSIRKEQRTWEKVTRVLDSGVMPPKDHKIHPDKADSKRVVAWIDAVFRVDCRLVDDPGRVTIRRLNRAEYNNTIRDLVGVDFNPAKDFPSDDVGYGFDNIGDVLSLPTLLMEKYLDAAETITDKAIVTVDSSKTTKRFSGRNLKITSGGSPGPRDFQRLSSTGEVYATFNFPQTGEYLLRAEAAADQAGTELAKMEFRIDGKKIKVFDVKKHRVPDEYEIKVRVTKGRRKFAAAFINDYYNPKAKNPQQRDRNLAVRFLEIKGPLGLPAKNLPTTHTRILFTKPGAKKTVAQAAREILTKFATRAFRRPATTDEINKLVRLVEFVIKQNDSFERGIQVAVQSVLVSPHFLFRVENDPNPNNAQSKHSVKDYELASRLSYFLWSSMPDSQLFQLAAKGELHRPEVLEKQVQRMLADPKANAVTQNFAAQWLNLRILDTVTPDTKRFPTFNGKLRSAMRQETELFFQEVMTKNRSILDFLDGNFSFLNERLAKHYGVPGVKGDQFRKVEFTGALAKQRAGVLTHASILTITSNATRTSPVKRGKWILANIFDTPPPPPPPGVPELDEKKIATGKLSLRKQFEIHRQNPVCASCHDKMDALGFGFENFNAIGSWREKDGKAPVDSSGTLPSGKSFSGPVELVRILKQQKAEFARCFTRKLLTFALGRGLEDYDKCAVDEIIQKAAKTNYRFTTIVTEIVKSKPFLMRRGDDG